MQNTSQLLAHEREVLGLYASGHPTHEFSALVYGHCTHSVQSLQSAPGSVIVLGMVTASRYSHTKARDPYIAFTIEDSEASTNAVVWPNDMKKCRDQIRNGNILVFTGKVQDRGEWKSFQVKEAHPPAEFVKGRRAGLIVRNISSELIPIVRDIVIRSPGPDLFQILVGQTLLRSRSGVSLSVDLVEQLAAVVGTENLRLVSMKEGAKV